MSPLLRQLLLLLPSCAALRAAGHHAIPSLTEEAGRRVEALRSLTVPAAPPGHDDRTQAQAQAASAAAATTANVTTSFGRLVGVQLASGVRRFNGIPFAEPPSGTRRFRPPVAWSRPWAPLARPAADAGPSCMQNTLLAPGGPLSEDCLFLNVWTPPEGAPRPASGWPVLVFVHGGAFVFGRGADYNCESFALHEELVVVTINYRLGALGWLLLEEGSGEQRGNFGLLDQRCALGWVQAQISNFGGDASAVTLWGQSAGAISIISHLSLPESKGLFARAIVESGGAVVHSPDYAARQALAVARQVNCTKGPLGRKMVDAECLRVANATAIVAAMGPEWQGLVAAPLWCPVIDGTTLLRDPLAAFTEPGGWWDDGRGALMIVRADTFSIFPLHAIEFCVIRC
jgi:para-nitrobenzyl esterase